MLSFSLMSRRGAWIKATPFENVAIFGKVSEWCHQHCFSLMSAGKVHLVYKKGMVRGGCHQS